MTHRQATAYLVACAALGLKLGLAFDRMEAGR